MKQSKIACYEERMKAQILMNMSRETPITLKRIFEQLLQANRKEGKYIISAYYKVKYEIIG